MLLFQFKLYILLFLTRKDEKEEHVTTFLESRSVTQDPLNRKSPSTDEDEQNNTWNFFFFFFNVV